MRKLPYLRRPVDDQWKQQLKIKWAPNSHKWRTVYRILIRLISLNTFFASAIRNIRSSVVDFSFQIDWYPWDTPQITVLSMARSWSYWHSMVASYPVTFSKILAKICLQVFPTLTRHTPVCLSSAIRRIDINTKWSAQGGLLLARHLKKIPC